MLSNKAITEIENFVDWIVILREEMEVHAKKSDLTSRYHSSQKKDILTPNKVWNVVTDLLTSGMINSMGTFWLQNAGKVLSLSKGLKIPSICQKLYHTLIVTLMNAIICMFIKFIWEHRIIDTNLASNKTNSQKRVKKGY